jgi:hypothetical protein
MCSHSSAGNAAKVLPCEQSNCLCALLFLGFLRWTLAIMCSATRHHGLQEVLPGHAVENVLEAHLQGDVP